MTLQALDAQLWELTERAKAANRLGYPTIYEDGEIRRLTASRERTRVAEEQVKALELREKRRLAIVAVVLPTQNLHRSFIRKLADHSVELALDHSLTVLRDVKNPHAIMHTGTICVPPVLNERDYAVFLHEVGHIVLAQADPFQQRYVVDASILSPAAECAAWTFALRTCWRGAWTQSMQDHSVYCLNTYRAGATVEERHQMTRTINAGQAAVVPPPDSFEGRVRRVNQIRRENIVQNLTPKTPKRDTAEARLRAAGLSCR